ncbi:putative C6 transcription factor [Fusarium sp. MPI-SDFR-AT-0072]|nr:putative C6 transcription factor [Fusarium sp. MPI-SDFR-AT-0072]
MDSTTPSSRLSVSSPHSSTADGTQKGRQRTITACLTCRRRKVKCDHTQPTCTPCKKGNRACIYASPQPASHNPSRAREGNRVSRSNLRTDQEEIRNRLERLERLLERAIFSSGNISQSPDVRVYGSEIPRDADQVKGASPNPRAETLSTDGFDGALLLEAEEGQSRWVSSLHYALLADQIHDVKMLLGDESGGEPVESSPTDQATPPFPFSATTVDSLTASAPTSADDCLALLNIFYSNVDPMTRLVHKPTLQRRFTQYINYTYGTTTPTPGHQEAETPRPDQALHTFEPLALAIFYSAINSLSAENVILQFGAEKEALLAQFQRGVELGLGRENFLVTPSIEVLQAFVLLLTCQSREDGMARTWTLLGLAVKMALSQGLHREPSLFPSSNMDVIQVETRRRLWHQICHLDFRSAEGRGQEPTISDEDYTTLLPRNVCDEDLAEGAHLGAETYSPPGFTDMTGHLIRLNGIQCFRRIVRSTYRLERRIKSSALNGNGNLYPIAELQSLFEEVRSMVHEMVTHLQTQYLQYCDPQVPQQRMALGLAAVIEWRCWSIFWLRTPKQYREAAVSPEIRQTVLAKSVSLIESLNSMPDDQDAQKFQWHIGGHACFQSIMHIVSELETPEFKAPNHSLLRARAVEVLKKTMDTRGREATPMWKVINRIISNCLAKNAPANLPLTPFQTVLPRNGVIPGIWSSTTASPSAVPQSLSASGESAIETSLLDLSEIGSIDMQDPVTSFDWGFWNLDPTDPSSY